MNWFQKTSIFITTYAILTGRKSFNEILMPFVYVDVYYKQMNTHGVLRYNTQ